MFKFITLVLIAVLLPFAAHSQTSPDPRIQQMISEISADSLKSYVYKLSSFETRHSFSSYTDPNRGIGAASNWVLSKFREWSAASNGRMTADLDPFVVPEGGRIAREITLKNVMATYRGSDPNDDRVFVISGHIDTRGSSVMDSTVTAPGANDDASGVALVMELARIMSKQNFPATILFVAVSGEEQGLFGAHHLAQRAVDEKWNIVAMLNNDMVGNAVSSETNILDNTRVRIFSETIPQMESDVEARTRRQTSGENDSSSRQLARYIKDMTEQYVDQLDVMLVYRNDRFLRGGDHTPFMLRGFTAIRVCEMNENYLYQHQDVRIEDGIQYGDLPEFIDYEYVRKNASLNLATLANLAWSPYEPASPIIDTSRLGNTSTLAWQAPESGNKPAGYYVLMRDTSSPTWQKKFWTTDTTITVPYSKDNYFFAVQSVSDGGHPSLAVFPAPGRIPRPSSN